MFISKNVSQKGIQKFNSSEKFIIKTYQSLGKNAIDIINNDNFLIINKSIYEKLQLFNNNSKPILNTIKLNLFLF